MEETIVEVEDSDMDGDIEDVDEREQRHQIQGIEANPVYGAGVEKCSLNALENNTIERR